MGPFTGYGVSLCGWVLRLDEDIRQLMRLGVPACASVRGCNITKSAVVYSVPWAYISNPLSLQAPGIMQR